MQISLDRVLMKNLGPAKDLVQMGATASCEAPNGDIVGWSRGRQHDRAADSCREHAQQP